MNNKKLRVGLIVSFCAIELGLLIAVLTCSGDVVRPLQFTSIALVFTFSLLFVRLKEDKNFIIQLALLFTVMADLFLVLIRPLNQALAMSFFSVTQMLYFVKILISEKRKGFRLANLISRIVAIVLVQVITLLVLKGKADYVSLISMFYFTNLVLNLLFAFLNFKQNPTLAIGLLLFMFCDIFVGLQSAIGVYIDIPATSIIYKIVFSPFNWAWFFYIPSQTLLSISCSVKNKRI